LRLTATFHKHGSVFADRWAIHSAQVARVDQTAEQIRTTKAKSLLNMARNFVNAGDLVKPRNMRSA
jgi:hypothetical protein